MAKPSLSTAHRPRRAQTLRLVIGFALLLACAFVWDLPLRYYFSPWSLPLGGRPAMTGQWSGPVALENGVSGILLLDLDYLENEDLFGLNIDGMAHYCLNDQLGEFEVYGEADRQGTIADLRFRSLIDNPEWLLYKTNSRWEGDQLIVAGEYSYDPTSVHIARSDIPATTLTIFLTRSTAERDSDLCQKAAP